MNEKTRYKILFLANWYPDRENPVAGIFIKKHAEAASRFCEVAVLHVSGAQKTQKNKYEIEYANENQIPTIRVRYKIPPPEVPFLTKYRHFRGIFLGVRAFEKALGKPDMVHVNVADSLTGLVAVKLKFFSKIPYIVTEHNTAYTDENGSFRRMPAHSRFLLGLIFKHADAVTAVSDYLLKALKKNFTIKEPAYIVPNVISIPDKITFEREPGKIRALSVSLLSDSSKNISGLIKAFAAAARQCGDLVLDIVGDGPDRRMLEGLARELGLLNKRVFFHGLVPNDKLEGFFRRANFFVLNSNYETFSVATAEALAHGLPVLITECGGPQEFVSEERGIIVKKRDVNSMAEGLELMASRWDSFDPAALSSYARERFAAAPVAEKIYRVYEKILSL